MRRGSDAMFNRFISKKRLKQIMEDKPCSLCTKHKTMECPNSGKCLATKDKPYFNLDIKKL